MWNTDSDEEIMSFQSTAAIEPVIKDCYDSVFLIDDYIFFAEHLQPECMKRGQELLILQLISEISRARRCSIILQNGRSLLIRKEGNDRLLLSQYKGSICLNEKKCTIGGEGDIIISS